MLCDGTTQHNRFAASNIPTYFNEVIIYGHTEPKRSTRPQYRVNLPPQKKIGIIHLEQRTVWRL